ncbi:MAG: hypothetical protein ACPG8W_21750 [Candidatus Promineifilaceae bacterium]
MFGNKQNKLNRLKELATLIFSAPNGKRPAQLARDLGVSRKTIAQDLGIVEKLTGEFFYEEDEFIFYYNAEDDHA